MESQTTPVRANIDFQWYPFSVSYLSTLSIEDRKKYVSNLSKGWIEYKDTYYKHHKDIEPNEWDILLQFYQKFQQWTTKTTETTTQTTDSLEEEQPEVSKPLERNDTIILQWNTQPAPTKTKTLSFSTDSSLPEEFYVQPNDDNNNNQDKIPEISKPTFFVPDSQGLDGEEQTPSATKQLPDVPEIPNSVTEISTQTEDQHEDLSGEEDVEEAPKETADKIEQDNSQMQRQATKPLHLEDLEDAIPENDKPSTPLQPPNETPSSTQKESKPQQPHRRVSSVIRALENDSVIKNKLPSPIPQPSPRKRGRPSKAEVEKRKELEMLQKMQQKEAQMKNRNTEMEPQNNNNSKPTSPVKDKSPVKNFSPIDNGKEYLENEYEELHSPQKSPHKTRQDLLSEIENLFKGGVLSPKKARVT